MDDDILKEFENWNYSKEYKECLEKASKLCLFEQFTLANELLANFQNCVNENKK